MSSAGATSTSGAEPIEPESGSAFWAVLDIVPAWGVSLLVHICLIFIIAMIAMPEIILP